MLTLILLLALAACGGGEAPAETGDGGDGGDGGELDVEQLVEDYAEMESFSGEAALYFIEQAGGVSEEEIVPDWEYVVDDSTMRNYGDNPANGYGHGSICFQKPEGQELSEEEYRAWAEKVFQATAAASDDGYNVIGYEFCGEGEDPLAQADFDSALDSWMPGWCYCKDGTYMAVYLEEAYDSELDSAIGRDLYYFGAGVDVSVGLQKSFEETMADMEQYFEENEEEIEEALEDYIE